MIIVNLRLRLGTFLQKSWVFCMIFSRKTKTFKIYKFTIYLIINIYYRKPPFHSKSRSQGISISVELNLYISLWEISFIDLFLINHKHFDDVIILVLDKKCDKRSSNKLAIFCSSKLYSKLLFWVFLRIWNSLLNV